MTISSSTRKAGPFIGTGLTTVFPFDYKVFADTDVLVVETDDLLVERTLELGPDYTVALSSDQENDPGGSVILAEALAEDYLLTLGSRVPDTQPVELTNAGGFYPRVINMAFDRLTILIQQLTEQLGRTLKLPFSTDIDPTFPLPVPNGLVGFNSDASGMTVISPTDLVTVAGYADARIDMFTGDGVETDFVIDFNPGVLANLDISISGVVQVAGVDFTWSGVTVIFATAPFDGAVIQVRYARPIAPVPDFDSILTSVEDAEAAAAEATASAAAAEATLTSRVPYTELAAPDGAGLVGFTHSLPGASDRTLEERALELISVLDFPTIQGANDALDTAGGKGATMRFPTGVFVCAAEIAPRDYTFLQGDGFRSTILNATFNGPTIHFDEVSDSGVSMVRLGLNTDDAAVGMSVTATAGSVAKLFVSNIEFGGQSVDGQVGLRLEAIGPQIITESVFANLVFVGCDTAIFDRDSEGNFFPCLTVDQFGFDTAGTALDLRTNANYYQGRIAGTTTDGSTGYKQRGAGNVAIITVDIGGGTRKALDVSDDTHDIIIVQRPEDLTPLGDVGYNNTVIDRNGSMFPHIVANGAPATAGQFALTDWGSTASVTVESGNDQCVRFTISSSGTGQALNPFILFTFSKPFGRAPQIASVQRSGGNQIGLNDWFSPSTSTTQWQVRWAHTPVAGENYTFTVMVV